MLSPVAVVVPVVWVVALMAQERFAFLRVPAAGVAVLVSVAAVIGLPSARLALLAAAFLLGVVLFFNRGLVRVVARRIGISGAILSVVPMVGHYLAALIGFAIGTLTQRASPVAAS